MPIIGTSVESIDIAEDRERFSALVDRARPASSRPTAPRVDLQQALHVARQIGFPVLVRPSFVLGGRAMEIVYDEDGARPVRRPGAGGLAGQADPDRPVPRDRPSRSTSIASATAPRTVIGGVMQHIEEAGIHSGDSACVIPPHSLPADGRRGDQAADARAGRGAERQGADERPVRRHRIAPTARRPARRRSTSSKSTRGPAARCRSCPRRPACRWPGCAALVMVGKTLDELGVNDEVVPTHFSVKESVFPFNKFPGVDIILGPEMRSTGEVMGIDDTLPDGVRQDPDGGERRRCRERARCSSRWPTATRRRWCRSPGSFAEMGFKLIATRGTARVPARAAASRSRRSRRCRRAGRT